MNCEESTKLMDGYLDGELDPITNQRIEQHLRNCRTCEQSYAAQRDLVRTIEKAPYYRASSELRSRIQSALREGVTANTSPTLAKRSQFLAPQKRAELPSIFSGASWGRLALAAVVVLMAIMIATLVSRFQRNGTDQFLSTQLISSHVRSLMANHLTDIASSDQHTVKPWLDAKLDFAPPVTDFASDGFPLVGGRLDYLDNRPVAALVYQRRKHFINLFIWPAEPKKTETSQMISRQGYQLLHWVDSDFNYWAVSDVNPNDLQTFRKLFK
jgi:anti-sigma factor RsiW